LRRRIIELPLECRRTARREVLLSGPEGRLRLLQEVEGERDRAPGAVTRPARAPQQAAGAAEASGNRLRHALARARFDPGAPRQHALHVGEDDRPVIASAPGTARVDRAGVEVLAAP